MGQHYLPRAYLRGFAVSDRIWTFDKTGAPTFQTQPKSVANENRMWADDLEAYLSREVEEPALPAIVALREGKSISEADREALARYIVVTWKRVPGGRDRSRNMLPNAASATSADIRKNLFRIAGDDPHLQARATDNARRYDDALADLVKAPEKIWASTVRFEISRRTIDALLALNWQYVVSNDIQILTGDDPVYFHQHEGIGHKRADLSFPLSSSLVLMARRVVAPSNVFVKVNPFVVKEFNRRTAFNAKQYVFAQRNEPWVGSLATKRHIVLNRLA